MPLKPINYLTIYRVRAKAHLPLCSYWGLDLNERFFNSSLRVLYAKDLMYRFHNSPIYLSELPLGFPLPHVEDLFVNNPHFYRRIGDRYREHHQPSQERRKKSTVLPERESNKEPMPIVTLKFTRSHIKSFRKPMTNFLKKTRNLICCWGRIVRFRCLVGKISNNKVRWWSFSC